MNEPLRPRTLNCTVNGQAQALQLTTAATLLHMLRNDCGLNGPRLGCGLGQCGACTVIVKGQAIRSCITTVKAVEGQDITTLEGIGSAAKPHPLQSAFVAEGAAQCGFCVNGVVMTAKAFLDKTPKPSRTQIRTAMNGVLCRCFTHTRMIRAIERAAMEMSR